MMMRKKEENLAQKIKMYIQTHHLLKKGDTVIVGVSAGPDSTALIHILHHLQYHFGIRLIIAHYNHQLRKAAEADQKFVEKLAKQLNIPFMAESWNHPKTIKKGSIEELAREQRIQFFIRCAKFKNANIIALAHHQDDLAETILMRILRGTGLQGLQGILPKREINGAVFIRPLLTIKRAEIEFYLNKNKIPYRTDATNRQTKFYRNKIRIELLPLLERKYKKNIKEVLAHLADNIFTDYDYLKRQAKKLFNKIAIYSKNNKGIQFNLKRFQKQHVALQRLLIRIAIEYLKGNTNQMTLIHHQEIEDLIAHRPTGSIVSLPCGIDIAKNYDQIIVCVRKT